MALGLLALAMYISCIFHVVCAAFSALATRKLADAEANSTGIWALVICNCFTTHISKNYIHFAVKYIITDFLTLSNSSLVFIGRIAHGNII